MENKIHEIANKKGISIAWLSRTSGVARSNLYEIMNNKTEPNLLTVKKIADALDTSISKLFPTA